jgi:site-specific recombinase XerD
MTTLTAIEQHQELGNLAELYLTSCRIEGKSPETVRSYRESLDIFLHAVHQEELPRDPTSFTAAHVYQFLSHVASTGVSAVTQWRRQRETRTFFSWLLRHDYIPSNPFAKVKNIKVPQKVIQPFSQEEILRLLACCDPAAHKGARDRALILVLLDTGLRASELASLQLDDIDFQSQRIQVHHGKGNKQRVVRIGNEAGQAARDYLESFRGKEPGPLFLTCRGRPLCRTAMRTIFQRLGKQASIPKVHPHRFRHTFATWAIEQQAREIDVQFLLGHSTPPSHATSLHRHLRCREGGSGPRLVQPGGPSQRTASQAAIEPRRWSRRGPIPP